jgi:formate hydrogenlyase subunit 3/multisubunit Na+/H+ antiporter MnhD subunit
MSMVTLVLFCAAALLVLAVLGVLCARSDAGRPLIYGASLLVCIAGTVVAGISIAGEPSTIVLPLGLPWLGAHFRLDALSAFFLAIINIGGAGASLYALGYARHEHEPGRVLPFYPAFLAGMTLVVVADDAFSFLFCWELMSLSSWALVLSHHHDRENTRAAYIYLLMATFGSLALLLAFGLLAGPGGGYAFAAMRETAHSSTLLVSLVLSLSLLGAGSKAGLVPLHVWLPLAHPAAPSHVSALMSGVMTKVAIYAFVRIVFDLLGPPDWWWSIPVLSVGGTTAALGVLYALMERDLKRLLAYSTIENVGIVFLGLGLAIAFRANGMAGAAALALTAALFHAFNHMLFKSVLFFGSGTVLLATGELNIERLGGLIHRMPYSSAAFLTACLAISALPPLNGFASEWLMFQSILVSPDLPQWGLKLLVPTVGTLLALAAALAAACFVRAFGITYLGRPRSAVAEQAHEADRYSLTAMIGFAVLCVVTGVFPGLVIDGLAPAVHGLVGARMPPQLSLPWLSIVPIADSRSSYNGLMIFLFSASSAILAAFVVHRLASRVVRRAGLWDCGYPGLGSLTQYSAASLSQPIRRVFGSYVFRSSERVEMPAPGEMGPARIRKIRHDLAWEMLYEPVVAGVAFASERLNALQFLTIRRYLGFVFVALVFLLLALALWQ